MGATIPPPKQSSAAGGAKTETKSQPKASAEDNAKREFEEQQEEEDEPALPLPELDNSGVMEDQTGDEEYPMGDPEKEVSEEDLEKANEHRDMAAAAFNEGLTFVQLGNLVYLWNNPRRLPKGIGAVHESH
jgi:hypothetical protein